MRGEDYSYLEYLYDIAIGHVDESYRCLLTTLNDIPFYYTIPRDENRMWDGLKLRDMYSDYFGNLLDPNQPCTVLEMMVGLCYRYVMEHATGNENDIPVMFFNILDNMGLMGCTDECWDETEAYRVRLRVSMMVNREYPASGEGSMFPLGHTQLMDSRGSWQ